MRFLSLRTRRPRSGPVFVFACWLACAVAGTGLALRYSSAAGPAARAPKHVEPAVSDLAAHAYEVLVFLHPRCPCSRATVEELDRIAARVGKRASIRVFVLADEQRGSEWSHSALWDAAARIPSAVVTEDDGGAAARAHGARTSGTTLCYSPSGALLFEGGITAARGHAGDNAGADAIVAAVLGERASVERTPVFGCELFDDASPEQRP
jgi:hypothetical protein